MKIKKIEELTQDWKYETWKVVELIKPNLKEIKKLFKETFEIIQEYSSQDQVPKEIVSLLLEVNDFSWWVSDLKDTPIHCLYQEIISLVFKMNKHFISCDTNIEEIEEIINEKLI